MIKLKFKNTLLDKMYVGLGVTLIIGLTVFSVINSNTVKNIESDRLTLLDAKEVAKLNVVEDIRLFLMIKDEKSYIEAKDRCNFTKEYKNSVFGSSYNGSKYFYADSVSIVDAQYSMEDDKFFIVANASKNGANYILNIVVSVSNGLIYDISLI